MLWPKIRKNWVSLQAKDFLTQCREQRLILALALLCVRWCLFSANKTFMISKEELEKLLPQLEQDRIEKTVSVNDAQKFGEAICAFANDLANHKQPGYLIIGARDDGARAGMTITEQNLQTLLSFRTDGRIVPPPSLIVSKFEFAEGELAVVEVQPHFLPPVLPKW